ncbi:hypothetical protein CEE69_13685 [Rhodopirellula bahusiensis]|uniref:Uncharacterized protein n=1 Tax=Rhodopirellula bahusiensis TaxID=2014065 RepID=A0A2G1W7A6_9BACT|nr:hypothetical protein CEE69_13685 [Rhodopirellula bahusiensis]
MKESEASVKTRIRCIQREAIGDDGMQVRSVWETGEADSKSIPTQHQITRHSTNSVAPCRSTNLRSRCASYIGM